MRRKKFNEFRDQERSNEEVVIEGAAKTTTQILHDKGLFSRYDTADEVLKDYLLIETRERF